MKINIFIVLLFLVFAMSVASAFAPKNFIGSVNQLVNVSNNLTVYNYYNPITLVVNDIEPTTHNVLITLQTENGDPLLVEEVGEGKTITKTVGGSDLAITVNQVADSSAGPARWANITLKTIAVTMPVGNSIAVNYLGDPNVLCYLDDVEVGTRDAAISFYNPSNISERHVEKVKEGGSITRNISGKYYKITVLQTSLATYDWAQSKIKIKIEPARSGSSFDNYSFDYVQSYLEYDTGGDITHLVLADLEPETRSAIFTLTDENGTVLANEKLKEGQTLVREGAGGVHYQIKLIQISAGAGQPGGNSYQGAWAKFAVVPTTAAESPNYAIVYMGTSYPYGDALINLTDFEKDTRKAMVVIDNTTGLDTPYYEKIGEGQTFVRDIGGGNKYSIKIIQTAAGYSYPASLDPNATWAKLVVQTVAASVPISPAIPNATVLFYEGAYIHSGDGFTGAQFFGVESPGHDASLWLQDTSGGGVGPDWGYEKIKEGGSVVKRLHNAPSNKYKFTVYQTARAYYNYSGNSWAKVNIEPTTAAETSGAIYATYGLDGYSWLSCPAAVSDLKVQLNGLETGSHYGIISLYNISSGEILVQDKIKTGSTVKYNVPSYGNCTVKVVQTFDDAYDFGMPYYELWVKLVVS